MTISWIPKLEGRHGPTYLAIAEALADEIAAGLLPPRYRLPTHRELADRLGLAVGTVTRAYGEAAKRGLVAGHGRRGTFVGKPASGKVALSSMLESESETIDLSKNYPPSNTDPVLSEALSGLLRNQSVQQLLPYPTPYGYHRHRHAGSRWVAGLGWKVGAESVVITNGAQHALMIILATIGAPGDTIVVEEHTYPGLLAIAEMLRLRVVSVPSDSDGPLPDALKAAFGHRRVVAFYCNPTLQNPTNVTVSEARRGEIAAVADSHGVAVVEDAILNRLVPAPPPLLSQSAPHRCYLVASVSKIIAGGLRVGFVVAPPESRQRLVDTLHTTTLMISPLPVEIVATWIDDGTSEKIVRQRRREISIRQALTREIIGNYLSADSPLSYHVWLQLPKTWTSSDFTLEAHRRGVAVAPAEAFAANKDKSARAVRVCLGAVQSRRSLQTGLEILANMLRDSRGSRAGTI